MCRLHFSIVKLISKNNGIKIGVDERPWDAGHVPVSLAQICQIPAASKQMKILSCYTRLIAYRLTDLLLSNKQDEKLASPRS